jgi:hypothetical protein
MSPTFKHAFITSVFPTWVSSSSFPIGVFHGWFLLLREALWMHPKIRPSKLVMARAPALQSTRGLWTALLPPFTYPLEKE